MRTLFFNGEAIEPYNEAWDTLKNWFTDEALQDSAGRLPEEGDHVVIMGQLQTPPADPVRLRSVTVRGPYSVVLTGVNVAIFMELNSQAGGTLSSDVVFAGEAENNGVVKGRAIFRDQATNSGVIQGGADVFAPSPNPIGQEQHVTGGITYHGEWPESEE